MRVARGLAGILSLVVATAVAACGDKAQSYAAGVALICATDREAGVEAIDPEARAVTRARWIAARLRNRKAAGAFAALGGMTRREQQRALDALAREAGLGMCRDRVVGTGPRWIRDVEVVALPATGTAPASPGDLAIVIAPGGVYVEGVLVAPARGRALTDEEARLVTGAVEAELDGSGDVRVQVVPARGTTYEQLVGVLSAIKPAGVTRFGVVGADAEGARAIPLDLPTAEAAAAFHPPVGEQDRAPAPVIALVGGGITVFSFDESLGTLTKPGFRTTTTTAADIARLQAALVDAAPLLRDARSALVMADPTVAIDVVMAVMAAVRATPDGNNLLPDLVLSIGFR